MKSKNLRRVLATTLAAAMMMGSAVTVCAADGSGGSGGTTSAGSAAAVVESAGSAVTSSDASAQGESSAPSVALKDVVSANAAISIGGSKITTTVAGAYAAKSVDGMAVITPLNDIKANLGLASDQAPYIMAFDTDAKKSNLAMASLNAAAGSLGVSMITTLNIDLGAKQNGRFVTLSNGSVNLIVGLPKAAIDPAKTYSVICVRPGGEITILEDQDTNPNTVTFAVKAGLGTYAIVAK